MNKDKIAALVNVKPESDATASNTLANGRTFLPQSKAFGKSAAPTHQYWRE